MAPAIVTVPGFEARRAGKTARDYFRALVERDLMSDRPFDEILRPVRADFGRAGVTEAQLDRIVGRARGARKPARRGPKMAGR